VPALPQVQQQLKLANQLAAQLTAQEVVLRQHLSSLLPPPPATADGSGGPGEQKGAEQAAQAEADLEEQLTACRIHRLVHGINALPVTVGSVADGDSGELPGAAHTGARRSNDTEDSLSFFGASAGGGGSAATLPVLSAPTMSPERAPSNPPNPTAWLLSPQPQSPFLLTPTKVAGALAPSRSTRALEALLRPPPAAPTAGSPSPSGEQAEAGGEEEPPTSPSALTPALSLRASSTTIRNVRRYLHRVSSSRATGGGEGLLQHVSSQLALAATLAGAGGPATAASVAGSQLVRASSLASSLGGGTVLDEYEAMCGVCLDAGDFVGMAPCGHKMCGGCASELLRLHPSGPAPCPFCRAAICGFSAVSQQLTPASQQHTPAPERVV